MTRPRLDKQHNRIGEGFRGLRPALMLGGLDAEVGHLLLDDTRIAPLSAPQQHLTGDGERGIERRERQQRTERRWPTARQRHQRER